MPRQGGQEGKRVGGEGLASEAEGGHEGRLQRGRRLCRATSAREEVDGEALPRGEGGQQGAPTKKEGDEGQGRSPANQEQEASGPRRAERQDVSESGWDRPPGRRRRRRERDDGATEAAAVPRAAASPADEEENERRGEVVATSPCPVGVRRPRRSESGHDNVGDEGAWSEGWRGASAAICEGNIEGGTIRGGDWGVRTERNDRGRSSDG